MLASRPNVFPNESLHLSVSMRSFRAENVSLLVKQLLDLDLKGGGTLDCVRGKVSITITRDLQIARGGSRRSARGRRYGIMVSSQAERLKPHAIDVKSLRWIRFIGFSTGRRTCAHRIVEDVATEFHDTGC